MSDLCGQHGFAQHLRPRHRIVPRHFHRDVFLVAKWWARTVIPPRPEPRTSPTSTGRPSAPQLGEQSGGFGAIRLVGQRCTTLAAYRRAGGADAEQDGQTTGAPGVIGSGIVMGVPAQHRRGLNSPWILIGKCLVHRRTCLGRATLAWRDQGAKPRLASRPVEIGSEASRRKADLAASRPRARQALSTSVPPQSARLPRRGLRGR